MSSIGTDPFSAVEAAIWTKLEAHAGLAALVKVANRVKMSVLEPNLKESAQDADMPELMMIPSGFYVNRPGDGVSSSSESISQRYTFAISTPTLSTVDDVRGINAIKWALLCVFVSGIDALSGLSYVRKVRTGEGQDLPAAPDMLARSVKGWRTVISLEVTMVFDRAFMTA